MSDATLSYAPRCYRTAKNVIMVDKVVPGINSILLYTYKLSYERALTYVYGGTSGKCEILPEFAQIFLHNDADTNGNCGPDMPRATSRHVVEH